MKIEPLENRCLLSVTPSLVEVPISAAAKAVDPELSNYRSFDLRVTITAGDDWTSSDINVVLTSGHFYVPGNDLNADYAQKSLWASYPNLEFDTFVASPNYGIPIILGGSYIKLGDAEFSPTTMDAAWGDLPITAPGTYTVARMTVSNDAAGTVLGRVGSRNQPQLPTYFGSALPLPVAQGVISGHIYWDLSALHAGSVPLQGMAYIDQNNNGLLDAGEPTAATVDQNATYTFFNLAAGTYTVRQVPIGAFQVVSPAGGANTITIGNDTRADNVNFGNYAPGVTNLSVIVFDDANANGERENNEYGIDGVVTYLDDNDNGMLDAGEMSRTTRNSGLALFPGVAIRQYNVRQILPDGYQLTTPLSGVVRMTPSPLGDYAQIGDHTSTPASPSVIRGYVYNDLNNDGIREANERGIGGVSIYLDIDHGDGTITTIPTTTGADGWYRFDSVPAGWCVLREKLPSGYALSRGFTLEQSFSLRGGTEETRFWGNYRDLRRVFSTGPLGATDSPQSATDLTEKALVKDLLV